MLRIVGFDTSRFKLNDILTAMINPGLSALLLSNGGVSVRWSILFSHVHKKLREVSPKISEDTLIYADKTRGT
jgi:hypothetical protein